MTNQSPVFTRGVYKGYITVKPSLLSFHDLHLLAHTLSGALFSLNMIVQLSAGLQKHLQPSQFTQKTCTWPPSSFIHMRTWQQSCSAERRDDHWALAAKILSCLCLPPPLYSFPAIPLSLHFENSLRQLMLWHSPCAAGFTAVVKWRVSINIQLPTLHFNPVFLCILL